METNRDHLRGPREKTVNLLKIHGVDLRAFYGGNEYSNGWKKCILPG